MHIANEIAALRSDPALQRRTAARIDEALAEWLALDLPRAITAGLPIYAQGADLGEIPALGGLMSEHEAAGEFVDCMMVAFVDALRAEPLGRIPFSHSCQYGFSMLQIMRESGVSLALLAYDHRERELDPETAIFEDREVHEIVLSGEATARFHSISSSLSHGESIRSEVRDLRPGSVMKTPDHCATRQITSVNGQLVLLQLSRTPKVPQPTREYRLRDGELLLQACGSKSVSQQEIALAVLGAMKRRDAVPVMAALATGGPAHLRWEAIRHTIALDSIGGIDLLTKTASQGDDELAAPASQLKHQLLATYPQLAAMEEKACPA